MRDHVDLLLSLKHRPTVTINDISNMTSGHGQKRHPGMFDPNNGRLDAPTDDILTAIANGTYQKSLPGLNKCNTLYEDMQDHAYSISSEVHPVTRMTQHFMLSDDFHKHNLSFIEDRLRDCALVPELAGLVNTETAEQLFSDLNKNMYFLNSMSPVNHIFALRLIIHLRNEKINRNFLKGLQQIQYPNTTLQLTSDGRVSVKHVTADQPSTGNQDLPMFPADQPFTGNQDLSTFPADQPSTGNRDLPMFPADQPSTGKQDLSTFPADQPSTGYRDSPMFPTDEPSTSYQDLPTFPADQPSTGNQDFPMFSADQPSTGNQELPTFPADQPSTGNHDLPMFPTDEPSTSNQDLPTFPADQKSTGNHDLPMFPTDQPSTSNQDLPMFAACQPSIGNPDLPMFHDNSVMSTGNKALSIFHVNDETATIVHESNSSIDKVSLNLKKEHF